MAADGTSVNLISQTRLGKRRLIQQSPLPDMPLLPTIGTPQMRFDLARKKSRFAVLAHVYYPDLCTEFADRLRDLNIDIRICF